MNYPAKYLEHGAYGLIRNGHITASANIDTPFVPASTIKILTSLLVIDTLGLDYRYTTEFYADKNSNLYIKGFGDPSLVSEEIPSIMATLKLKGITEIRSIYMDDSSFQLTTKTDGTGDSLNPYDVSCGGLVVNFNTVNIKKDDKGHVYSAETQTPFLPIMEELGKKLPPGTYRLNVSNTPANDIRLVGQLFRAFQRKAGIKGSGAFARKTVDESAEKIHIHRSSKNLEELLTGMLLYSNNFIANQLFLSVGAKYFGFPATWEKARSAMETFIRNNPAISDHSLSIVEGSGLSRKNKVSANTMLHVLELFKPYAYLLPERDGDLVKSGTLTGVYCYAGYLRRKTRLDSFVIMLNQGDNTRDRILKVLRNREQ